MTMYDPDNEQDLNHLHRHRVERQQREQKAAEEERRKKLVRNMMNQPFNVLSEADARVCVDLSQAAVDDAIEAIKAKCLIAPSCADTMSFAMRTLAANMDLLVDAAISAKAEVVMQEVLTGRNPAAAEGLRENGMMPGQTACDCPSCTIARGLVESGGAKVVMKGDGFMVLDLGGETKQ